MAYQMVIEIKGDSLKDSTNVLDQSKADGQTAIDVFNKYVANDWITQYNRKDITETHVEDTIVFVSKEKREDFRAELHAIHGGDTTKIATMDTLQIKEEGEV